MSKKIPPKNRRVIQTKDKKTVDHKTGIIEAVFFPNQKYHEIFFLVLISVFTFFLYLKTLSFPFHFDDEAAIINNTALHATSINWDLLSNMIDGTFGLRPLPFASFALNYYFGKTDTFGYHLVNILIHIINGVLVFYFCKMTLTILYHKDHLQNSKQNKADPKLLIPLFSSFIWLVHPLQTNSVTYIVQRMNSMMVLFYMLSLILFIKARMIQTHIPSSPVTTIPPKRKPAGHMAYLLFLASGFTGILSVGCKENAVTLPFFILLYDLFFFQDLRLSAFKRYILFAGIGSALLLLLFHIVIGFQFILEYSALYYEGYTFTMSQRVMTEWRVVVYYISLLLFPHPSRLNFDHDFSISASLTEPPETLLSLCLLIFLAVSAIYMGKRNKILSYGILWFLGNLAIESSIIPLDIIFEHRTYLPSVMISLIITTLIWAIIKKERYKLMILSTIAIILSFWTVQRNAAWQTSVTLWQDCAQKSPQKDRPHANLGKALEAAGRIDEAMQEYLKTLEINPYQQFTLNNTGLIMYRKGNLDQAIVYFQRALKSDPDFAEAHNNLGVALIDQKKLEQGIFHYKQAIRLNPDHPDATNNLNKALDGLAQINNRIADTQNIIKQSPENPDHFQYLGFLHYRKGNFDDAMKYYHKALSIDSTHTQALKGIALIHTEKKEYDLAIPFFKQMLEKQQEDSEIFYNIACIYALQNKNKDAIFWLKKAIGKGFQKWDLIKTDKDLNNIRKTDDFIKILNAEP